MPQALLDYHVVPQHVNIINSPWLLKHDVVIPSSQCPPLAQTKYDAFVTLAYYWE